MTGTSLRADRALAGHVNFLTKVHFFLRIARSALKPSGSDTDVAKSTDLSA
jgi:hypothetical protein